MSKHFSTFKTSAQFNSAAASLEYPHISLIELGDLMKYAKFEKKELYNAHFGDIVIAEVSSNELYSIPKDDYNLNDYPFADYKPIAVCVFESSSNNHNEAVFLSAQWGASSSPYIGATATSIQYFPTDANLSGLITIMEQTDKDGKQLYDEAVVNYESYLPPAITNARLVSTPGTSVGDWYLPSKYDLSAMSYDENLYLSFLKIQTTVNNSSYLSAANSNIGLFYHSSSTSAAFVPYVKFNNNSHLYTEPMSSSNKTNNIRYVFYSKIKEV